ncbi:AsmA family protein [Thermodesulfovibrio thiophilus]|uniref:AsmA family protein n=1 Tax=Thermodesulfovibrio thiophilus TaxID=340095 RepID=UPI001806E248|nr:AsmA family protein [Thermodesulfovibrio thiophilus]HHW20569.1 AsmA family protein [Thermodesulfovibrio thiophilus]
MIKKILIVVVLFIILSIAGFILFFPFDSFIKQKVEKAIGHNVSIKYLSVKWSKIVAYDIVIKTPAGTTFLDIKSITLTPYILPLLKKRVEIKEILMDSSTIFLIRTKQGKWLLPEFSKKEEENSSQKEDKKSSIELAIKEFKVTNANIIIQDDLKGFNIKLYDVAVNMSNKVSLFKSDETVVTASAKFPDRGDISLKAKGNFSDEKFTGSLTLKDLNMTLLRPYIRGGYTVKRGRLSFYSNFNINKGYVKAPSILRLKDLDIKSSGFFMGVSAPLLIEFLKEKDEIVLNCNIWGKWNNLKNDIPESLQKKITQQIGRTVTSPLRSLTNPIENLIKESR